MTPEELLADPGKFSRTNHPQRTGSPAASAANLEARRREIDAQLADGRLETRKLNDGRTAVVRHGVSGHVKAGDVLVMDREIVTVADITWRPPKGGDWERQVIFYLAHDPYQGIPGDEMMSVYHLVDVREQEPATPEVDWVPMDDNRYAATHKGKEWHVYLEDDGALPAGWRLWRTDRKYARPVAAAGRPVDFVLQQAALMVVAQ